MPRPTGRRPGRPPSLARAIRLRARDEAEAAFERLLVQAQLGDAQACGEIVRLALDGERPERPDVGA